MIKIPISASRQLYIEYLVLDFNGTLACDGMLEDSVRALLQTLSGKAKIYVLTADTFGTAKEQLEGSTLNLHIVPEKGQAAYKHDFITGLGPKQTAAIGNGTNDHLMLKTAVLGIGIMGREGISSLALNSADIICRDIRDALELFVHPKRIKATLRE